MSATTVKRIAVLVSSSHHPVSGFARHCENDSKALRMGLDLAQALSAECLVLHVGEPKNPALLDYLAFGAQTIQVIALNNNADGNTNMVTALAAQLKNVDLILTGSIADHPQASGLLPYLLAHQLDLPLVENALRIEKPAQQLEVLQFLPKGKRRLVAVSWPAVVAVHAQSPVTLNYRYANKISGRIEALGLSPNSTVHTAAINKPLIKPLLKKGLKQAIKLEAPPNKSGHARLQAIIESPSQGGAVVNNQNDDENAQVILRYLREHQLIDF
jgi:electron transfer flavoprotein beta subunit